MRWAGRGGAGWGWARALGGALILGVLAWRLGAGPFLDGVRHVDVWSVAAAAVIAVVTTACCAWRWSIVARGLGAAVAPRAAVVACYRSQFLNTTLPGGVLGDVDRALRHGPRAVAWERVAGQGVQACVAVSLLVVLPSPVQSSMPVVLVVVAAMVLVVVLLRPVPLRKDSSVPGRLARAAYADLMRGLLARRAWPGIVVASTLAVAGHVLTFLIAARVAGSLTQLLPLALVVLVAMGLPLNVAGWGPREGAAAWVFGAAGLGAGEGVAVAVAYGVLVLVASLPGALVLLPGLRGAPRG